MLTPDDMMAGQLPAGKHIAIFDDDHYYMASVLAELLVRNGSTVTFVTPAAMASAYSINTMEQALIQQRLLTLGVKIVLNEILLGATAEGLTTACAYAGTERMHPADSVLLVTSRRPDDALYGELKSKMANVRAVGDAWAPATIAHAVHAGRRYAEEFGLPEPEPGTVPFRREFTALPGA
jgi:dimethylamine/trimethylamine dehydrogenase